jgi:hypothetical protein
VRPHACEPAIIGEASRLGVLSKPSRSGEARRHDGRRRQPDSEEADGGAGERSGHQGRTWETVRRAQAGLWLYEQVKILSIYVMYSCLCFSLCPVCIVTVTSSTAMARIGTR